MSTTVHVSNISHETTRQQINDFFSFCGKINSLVVTPSTSDPDSTLSATVTYEREPAAKTALLLDGTKLGPNPVKVEATHSLDEIAGSATADADGNGNGNGRVRQEDKPKTAILAEYLSHGYEIGETALQKSIEVDSKHGISSRFLSTLNSALAAVEAKTHATQHARQVDQQYHVSDRATEVKHTLATYFEKALESPAGQKVRQFYATGGKNLLDIHNEAKRLAELRKQQQGEKGNLGDKTICDCAGNEGVCTCEPGKCGCAGCPKAADSAGYQSGQVAKDATEAVKDFGTAAQEKK